MWNVPHEIHAECSDRRLGRGGRLPASTQPAAEEPQRRGQRRDRGDQERDGDRAVVVISARRCSIRRRIQLEAPVSGAGLALGLRRAGSARRGPGERLVRGQSLRPRLLLLAAVGPAGVLAAAAGAGAACSRAGRRARGTAPIGNGTRRSAVSACAVTHTGVWCARRASRRCCRRGAGGARGSRAPARPRRGAAPTATRPCTAQAVDCALELAAGHLAEAAVGVLAGAQVGHRPPRRPRRARRPAAASACSTAPVMSLSLGAERATPEAAVAVLRAQRASATVRRAGRLARRRAGPGRRTRCSSRNPAIEPLRRAARAISATRLRPPKRRGERPAARSTRIVRSSSPDVARSAGRPRFT